MTIERGDVFNVDLNPIKGREQAGPRFVLIVLPRAFNFIGTPLVCPITQGGNFAREAGFAVSLNGTGMQTQGVVFCNQVRAIDLQARGARFVEKAPGFIVEEVLARLATLIE